MKRHKWGKDKYSGSFASNKRCAVCEQCGALRERHDDCGSYRLIYREASPYAGWVTNAPTCTVTRPTSGGAAK